MTELIELFSQFGNFGMAGLFIAYLIYNSKQQQKRGDKSQKARFENDAKIIKSIDKMNTTLTLLNEKIDNQKEVLELKIDSLRRKT